MVKRYTAIGAGELYKIDVDGTGLYAAAPDVDGVAQLCGRLACKGFEIGVVKQFVQGTSKRVDVRSLETYRIEARGGSLGTARRAVKAVDAVTRTLIADGCEILDDEGGGLAEIVAMDQGTLVLVGVFADDLAALDFSALGAKMRARAEVIARSYRVPAIKDALDGMRLDVACVGFDAAGRRASVSIQRDVGGRLGG